MQIFMRKYFMVQHYPRNVFNIELFLNYGISGKSLVPMLQILTMYPF